MSIYRGHSMFIAGQAMDPSQLQEGQFDSCANQALDALTATGVEMYHDPKPDALNGFMRLSFDILYARSGL